MYGEPVSTETCVALQAPRRALRAESFGLTPEELRVSLISPHDGRDQVGIVYALEGDPLPKGAIACRLGGYEDIEALEAAGAPHAEIVGALLGNKNELHNNYQDFQAFLDNGGRIGLQHDPLLPGAYLLNPFLIRVELTDMLVVQQGEVARDQELRRPADRGHERRRVQVRLDRASRGTRASGRSRCAPASTR